MKYNDNKSAENSSFSGVLGEFIFASLILGFLLNLMWWYYKYTSLSGSFYSENSYTNWMFNNDYEIFKDGSFIFSLCVSIAVSLVVMIFIWSIFKPSSLKKSDTSISLKKDKSDEKDSNIEINSKIVKKQEEKIDVDINIENDIKPEIKMEVKKEKEVKQTKSPELKKTKKNPSIKEEVLDIKEIEKDFEKYNLLFVKRIYGERVHRRKILELEEKKLC